MSKTVTSSMIPFVDTTDARRIECSIASNLPTVQVYDQNTGGYSPNWSETNLILTPTVYMEATNVTTPTLPATTTYVWYRKDGTDAEVQVSTNQNLTISTNITHASGIVTYRCVATYKVDANDTVGISATSSITFSRTNTGINGTNGSSAPPVKAQYSVSGLPNSWVNDLNPNTHKYIHLSYDNGANWTSAIKIAGEDGTSVTIKGTAYYDGTLSNSNIGQNLTLYSDSGFTTTLTTSGLNTGDAYIVQGYLCVFAQTTDKFVCTGTIQGPQGQQGVSSYTFIKYATDSSGANISDLPTNDTKYIGIAITTTNTAPSLDAYTWSKFVGDDAKSITLTADSQVFRVSNTNVVEPSTIAVTAQTSNTTVTTWTYSVNNGQNFLSTAPAGVSRNGNTVNINGINLTSNSLIIKASDGTYSDTITIFKVFDGNNGTNGTNGNDGASAPIAFLTNENVTFNANENGQVAAMSFTTNVVAYNGTTKVMPTLDVVSDLPEGMSYSITDSAASTEKSIAFTISNDANLGSDLSTSGVIRIHITSPVNTNLKLNWSKVNNGISGTPGNDAVTFQVYSDNGYILSKDLQEITLRTFAYKGSEAITSGMTYKWSYAVEDDWIDIENSNQPDWIVTYSDVDNIKSYMCTMEFENVPYRYSVTIEDKSDIIKTFTTKPDSYSIGDVWIVGNDYAPINIEEGTILKAEQTSDTYSDSDWGLATKYDQKMSKLSDEITKYNQYFSLDTVNGITMAAIDSNGNRSPFSTNLTNAKLSFNQGSQEVAYISNNKLNITEAEIISPLSVTGRYSGNTMLQAPTINLGSFSLIVESNGSLSIVANT